ncbi:MAG: hypothetical protein ABSG41_05380 [Bryobacteraceae bacterium]|jgi:hypothetical protein
MRRKPDIFVPGASNDAPATERQELRDTDSRPADETARNHQKAEPELVKPALSHSDSDIGAAIAHDEITVAHLYIHRGRIFLKAGDMAAAAADKSRAEETYARAVEAAETANTAGQEAIQPLLLLLKADLDSFQVSKATATQ